MVVVKNKGTAPASVWSRTLVRISGLGAYLEAYLPTPPLNVNQSQNLVLVLDSQNPEHNTIHHFLSCLERQYMADADKKIFELNEFNNTVYFPFNGLGCL